MARCTSDVVVARYYDPATAQFLTRDPIEGVTGQPYQYGSGDPLGNSDPLGLFSLPSWQTVKKVAEVATVVAVVATVTVIAAPVLLPAGAVTAGIALTAASTADAAAMIATAAAAYAAAGQCTEAFNSGSCSRAVAEVALDRFGQGLIKAVGTTPFPGKVAARAAEAAARKTEAAMGVASLGASALFGMADQAARDCPGGGS